MERHSKIFEILYLVDKASKINCFCTDFSNAFDLVPKYMFMKKLELYKDSCASSAERKLVNSGPSL